MLSILGLKIDFGIGCFYLRILFCFVFECEGGLASTQESFSEKESSMEDAGCELSPPEISSSVLTTAGERFSDQPEFLKKEVGLPCNTSDIASSFLTLFSQDLLRC